MCFLPVGWPDCGNNGGLRHVTQMRYIFVNWTIDGLFRYRFLQPYLNVSISNDHNERWSGIAATVHQRRPCISITNGNYSRDEISVKSAIQTNHFPVLSPRINLC